MPDKFSELIRKLRNDDNTAILSIRKNIETIVANYLSKNYIETEWIASEIGPCEVNLFYENLFEEVLKNIKQQNSTLLSFDDYKNFIIEQSNEKIRGLFNNFYRLLVKNDDKAWLIFNRILKFRLKCWLAKKGIIDTDILDSLYQDSIAVFIKKVNEGELIFEDSRFLKSYIFKIINLKLFELNRELKHEPLNTSKQTEMGYADKYDQYIVDLDSTTIKEKLLGSLNELEMKILTEVFYHEKKLKDVAQKFNISEANCRVIKYRALAKLAKPAKQLGYY